MQVKTKVAAGGIVVRKDDAGALRIVLVQHAEHKGWGFPKGHLDPGEEPRDAALREVEEETGAQGVIIQGLPVTRYRFTSRKGNLILKTVYWYLMRYTGEGMQTHAHEIEAMEWCGLGSISDRLRFDLDRELFEHTLQVIQGRSW